MIARMLIACALVLASIAVTTSRADDGAIIDSVFQLKNVESIASAGVPGPLAVFGERAFALVAGKQDDGTRLPVAAGAEWEKGRVVALGHGGMMGGEALRDAGTVKFVTQSVEWLAGGASAARVGVLDNEKMVELLKKAGLSTASLEGDWSSLLTDFDVVVIDAHDLMDAGVRERVGAFVRGGGGLLTAGLGWGWLQLHPGKSIQDHPGNLLLRDAGVAWCDGTLDPTLPGAFKVQPLPETIHAGEAIRYITRDAGMIDAKEAKQAGATLLSAVRVLRADHPIFVQASTVAADRGATCVPTEKKPLKESASVDRLALAVQVEVERRTPANEITAHPAAGEFPGVVPKDAPRVERTLEVDLEVPDWHSTGLYVWAGEVVTITVDERGAECRARIGCHADTLWHHRDWKRVPDVSREFSLTVGANHVASAFGGLLYIDVPGQKVGGQRDHRKKPGTTSIRVAGAIEAPLFVLGTTTDEQWKVIRSAPAPWGELASDKVIVSIPSEALRSLEDPAALMEFWNKISDAHAALAAIEAPPSRPHRYVPDVQISAGYMHSGYPIMTHMDAVDDMTTLAKLKAGPWGLLHELGHNHQEGDWTFDGTGEVTCNLFALHAIDTICERESGRGHGAVDKPPSLEEYLKDGADFRVWKRNPFLALHMYVEMEDAFGWETFKQVFAEYRGLSRSERPKGDDEKRDQWMVRFSRACGKNLGAFFQAWGVPTSEEARRSIADLPTWMPADWPSVERAENEKEAHPK